MIRFAIAAAAGIGLSMIAAAPSHADTTEQAYIKRLDANNIHYGTRSQGLAMGHAVCGALDAGAYTPATVVEALRHDDRLSYDDAAAIAAAAIAMFCPWDKS
jgi:Protein of unknown function (DUF732)